MTNTTPTTEGTGGATENLAGWGWVKRAIFVPPIVAAILGIGYFIHPDPIEFHAEGGPIEWTQFGLWGLAAIFLFLATKRAPTLRDRMNAGWYATLITLAIFRELDFHQWLNSDRGPFPGVHFRTRWLIDASQPLGPKIVLGAFFVILMLLLTVPPLFIRTPIRFFWRGDAATWLFILAIGLMGFGYMLDDILGRGLLFENDEILQGVEEYFELLGVMAMACSAFITFRKPLTTRIRAMKAQGESPCASTMGENVE